MISIYLRPDRTQILSGYLKKDLTFQVETTAETDAALGYLLQDGEEAENGLLEFFQRLKREIRLATEDVYVVLPDYLFNYIDTIDYISDANLRTILKEHTGLSAEQLYYTMPVETASPAPSRKSIYAIPKTIVDRLTQAAMEERIALTSIEPASLSLYRALGNFDLEMPIVEIFPEHATIITYSPAGGIFSTDAPNLTEKRLTEADLAIANQLVSTSYSANDYAASQIYMNLNTDMPYYVLTDNPTILSLNAAEIRTPEQAPQFPSFVRTRLAPDNELLWMPVLGTLFQAYDQLEEKLQSDNPVYENKPNFITFGSGNLLPENAKQAAKNRQWKRIIQHFSKRLSIFCGGAIAAEIAACLFFSSYQLSPALQTDYAKAKTDLAAIQNELKVIDEANKENQNVVNSYRILTLDRPDGLGFSTLKLGSASPERDSNEAYLTVTAVAGNEMLLEDFRSNLSYEKNFEAPTISSISMDSSGFKIANLSAKKGGTTHE